MRSFKQVKQAVWSALCLVLLASWISAQPVANKPFTLTRSAWQWDRSDIGWPDGKVPDKKAGTIHAGGWADYDFTVPATGWYELYLHGGVSGWDREVFLDGKRVYFGVAAKEDIVATNPEEVYKQGNLPLTAGQHTLRIRRLAFPGVLPASWELRAAVEARARITAEAESFTILRTGESLVLKVTGGAGPAADYELLARKEGGPDTYKLLTRVAFPESKGFVTKTVRIPCTEEGVFALRGRVDGKLLYPVDLLANNFAVVDTKHAPTAPANARQTLLHDIDCVKQTDMGKPIVLNTGYWEASGATRITTSVAGSYRESGDNNDPDLPSAPPPHQSSKSLASFSYLADVPQSGGPYLLEVDYPDDDRRTVNVIVLEKGTSQAGFGYPVAQLGSGYESGDWYPLSQKMLTHRVIFWTKYPQVRIALVSMNPAMRAAAAHIRVSRLDEGLPAGPANRVDGRLFGSFMEEPGRWGAHFRTVTDNPVTMQADYVGIERWIQLCRYLGINYLQPTEAVYQSPTYDSQQLEGWFKRAYDTPRLVALMCEKYGLKYVPELHISAQGWFTSRVARKLVANPDDLYLRNWLGNSAEGDEWNSYHPCWNALHPAIQAKYIAIFGELVDKIGPTTALGGVSSRLMSWVWQSWNALPSLNWGYEDWTMKQFAKETGITVPGKDGDPERFRQRFTFLTGAKMRETWIAWRCQKMLDYHRRLRDRIRQNNPNAVLYLPYYGGMDISLGSLSSSPKEQLREMGIDIDLLAKEPGIAIVPSAGFGRRDSSPETDQTVIDGILDPEHKALGFGFERAFNYGNAYFEVHERIPVDKLGFPDIKPGGYCGAADGAGRNMLERLSVVLADQDSSTMYQGGLGYTYGQPEFMQEWLAEYKQLPKLPFTPLAEGRDPVAVWYRDCPDGFYCYTVNREAYPVTVVLQLAKANALTALGTGKSVTLK
ncbi:MAG TPA: hypothetical protein VGL77_11370, partial [Armatimonadota bacterium]